MSQQVEQQQEQLLPCETQLSIAESCINADIDTGDGNTCSSCVPYPFRDTFSLELEGSFQRTLEFYKPDDDDDGHHQKFCNEANKNVCE